MMSPLTPAALKNIYRRACLAELHALKIGNTHLWGRGKDSLAAFAAAAELSKQPLCHPAATVGERIFAAALAVKPLGGNLNLGIILLAAPILYATQTYGDCTRQTMERTLQALTVTDAEYAFAAIRLLRPSALKKRVRRQDVAAAPSQNLRRVMALAEDDLIAAEYSLGFPQVFAGGDFIGKKGENGRPLAETLALLHLRFVAMGDSHLLKSVSAKAAKTTAELASRLAKRLKVGGFSMKSLLEADEKLKRRGHNPGTSADLVVASMLVAFIRQQW